MYRCVWIAVGVGLALTVTSCRRGLDRFTYAVGAERYEAGLERKDDSLYVLYLHTSRPSYTTWKLPYPVYRFDYGDVNGDGTPEIAVGVIKPTRFYPTPDKRLFLFRIVDGTYIRPLWLGARVAQPLEDFRIVRTCHPACIRTLERERSGRFLVAEYTWKGFGLKFNGYLKREVNLREGRHILDS